MTVTLTPDWVVLRGDNYLN